MSGDVHIRMNRLLKTQTKKPSAVHFQEADLKF